METESNDLKLLVYRIETGIGLFAADGIVCLTDPYRAQLEHSNGALFDESRVHVIPNGIDERRTFVPANEERTAPQTPVRFGMQSRINAKKDHDTLLRAFATVVDIEGAPPVELSIAGDGDTRPQVERLIQQLGLEKSVSLEGLLDTTDLAAWLQGLDVYVHATHGESFCFSVMEALACGLPVIASRVPVLDRTLAAVKAVSLYPAGDVPVLADLMYDAIRDPEHWRARCVAAREYAVDALPASRMVERYMELFNSLPSGSPVSRSRRLAMRAIDLTVASLRARI